MGAPKQKWTTEEESALRGGIQKYGAGKWSAILRDPIFGHILCLRSNVDLKDKWRNISVTAQGWGSREKARLALKKSTSFGKQSRENPSSSLVSYGSWDSTMDPRSNYAESYSCSPQRSSPAPAPVVPSHFSARFERLAVEAVANLNEHRGSKKTAIESYIEENYLVPHNFRQFLSASLKSLVANGKLVKIGQNYRIPEKSFSCDGMSKRPAPSVRESERYMITPEVWKKIQEEIQIPTKADIDEEISAIAMMNAEDAAKAAAEAVRAAEIAIAEAEEAMRDAEVADADLEAAHAFAEATKLHLRNSRSF